MSLTAAGRLLSLLLLLAGGCGPTDPAGGDAPRAPRPELADAERVELQAAIAAVQNGQPEVALRHLQPWIARADASPEAQFVAGQACYDLQRHEEAVRLFQAAIAGRPEFLGTSSSLGFAHYKLGRYADARACFRAILDVAPKAYKAHYGLALVEFTEGHLDRALPAVNESLAQQPEYLKALYLLGRIRQAGGEPGQALELYTHVLERWPGHEEALYQLAQVQQDLGLHEAAQHTLARRAEVYAIKERLGGLVASVRAGHDSVEIRRLQVQLQESLGEREEALRAARAGLFAFPGDAVLTAAAVRLARQD